MDGPVLLHVLTDKGHGFEPADEGPGQVPRPGAVPDGRGRDHPAQDLVEQGLHRRRQRRPLRGDAARPQGRRPDGRDVRGEQAPEDPRRRSPTGSSTSASARATPSPSPPAWPRPAPGRSSTSTARSSSARSTRSSRRSRSRTCRSSSRLDRAGLVGADGPTHHGTLRPGLHADLPQHGGHGPRRREGRRARCSTSPWGTTAPGRRSATPRPTSRRSTARSSRSSWARPRSSSGRPTACSWPAARWSATCLRAAERLREQHGLRVGVVNARFVKPLDRATVLQGDRGVRRSC